MRIWLQPPARPLPLTPGATFSVALHAALIGGAVFGGGVRAPEQGLPERVYFLPPPDRLPALQPSAPRVKYAVVGRGAAVTGAPRTAGRAAGDPDATRTDLPDQRGADARTQAERPSVDLGSDSVFSVLTVDESASRVAGSAAPVYPPTLLALNVEGRVTARFVVDTTGYAQPATIEIVDSSHPDFTHSVRDALAGMRYNPGRVNGHLVRQLVEQAFEFHIAPPVPPTVAEHTRATPPA